MNKRVKYICVLLLLAASISAAGRYDIHLVNVWGGAGYSAMLNSNQYNTMVGGAGGMIGVGYEYRNRRFMLNIGPEFRIISSRDNVLFENYSGNPYSVTEGLEYISMTKYYRFSDFHETQLLGQLMVPIMAGMNLTDWYWLAGFKVGYTLMSNYTQRGVLKTTISDAAAFDDNWENLYSHDILTNPDYVSKGSNPFEFDATISAEIGININSFLSKQFNEQNNKRKYPYHFRVGMFVDYGLPNLNVHSAMPMVKADAKEAVTWSYHTSEWSTGRLSSFLVGVKFTALLQLNKPKGKKPLNPRMAFSVIDDNTGKAVNGVTLQIYSAKTKRTTNRSTNQRGMSVSRYPAGDYSVLPKKIGYLPYDTIHVTHSEDLKDTITISLKPEPIFRFSVVDAKTQLPLSAKIDFTNTANNAIEFTANTEVQKDGKSAIKLKYGQTYKAVVSAPDYITGVYDISRQDEEVRFVLQPVEKGRKYVITNLFFASNQTTILPESEVALKELYEFMNDNKDVRIRIVGHTDAVGSETDNQKLSEGRAQSVKADIVARGIAADRIETVGKGESEPVATNDTEEGRAQNRRVEFEIL